MTRRIWISDARCTSIYVAVSRFPNELRGDFELISEAPYTDAIQEAVSHIGPNVKLESKDFETDIRHEVLFEHTAEGIQVRQTPGDIRDI